MAVTIKLKNASGSDPSASDLVVGEVALRTDSGQLFTKKDNGSIQEIGAASGVSDGDKGDITVSSSGSTFTIDNGVVNNAKIASNAAIAGSKIDPDFGSQNISTTGTFSSGDVTLTDVNPSIKFTESDDNPDYKIVLSTGKFRIYDITNTSDRLVINTDGHVDVTGNLDVGAGLDVTGDIIASAQVTANSSSSEAGFISKGDGSSTDGYIQLNCSQNSHGIKLSSPPHSAAQSYTLTFPSSIVNNGFLKTDSNGNLSFAAVNTDLVNDTSPQLGGDLQSNGNDIDFADDDKAIFGTGSDNNLEIFHESSSNTNEIIAADGDIHIQADNFQLISDDSGGRAIFLDNSSGHLELGFDGNHCVQINGSQTEFIKDVKFDGETAGRDIVFDRSDNQLEFADDAAATFGTDDDLKITHSGSNGNITNSTGDLIIRTLGSSADDIFIDSKDDVNIRVNDTADAIKCIGGGAIELYHSGTKKAETVSGGFTVTGTCTATTFSGSGASLTSLNASNISSGTIAAARVATLNQDTTGNAATATALETARNIAGTSFDGSANIDINYNNLTNKPTIPTNNNQLTNGAGYITSAALSGAGDGGNAALLDGIDSTQFLRSDADDTTTGKLTCGGSHGEKIILTGANQPFIRFHEGSTEKCFIQWHTGGYLQIGNQEDNSNLRIHDDIEFSTDSSTWHKVWHAGNDGAGSGLDADKLDGETSSFYLNYNNLSNTPTIPSNTNQLTNGAGFITSADGGNADQVDGLHASSFIRSDTADTASGDITFSGGGGAITMSVGSDIRFSNGNGWTGEVDHKIQAHSNNLYLQYRNDGNFIVRDSGGTNNLVIDGSGNGTFTGNVTAFSDATLKTNIKNIDNALNICNQLRGVSYIWRASGDSSIGVIAQEIEKVVPEIVLDNKNTDPLTGIETIIKSVDYGKITSILINAVNELSQKIKQLEGDS